MSFTPPARQRVDPGFRLDIANRSINPNYSGINKVSAPLSLMLTRPAVPDLDAWLGHHRVAKARREGAGTLPAFKLRCPQHVPFLTSARAYEKYVEYWNSKVRNLKSLK